MGFERHTPKFNTQDIEAPSVGVDYLYPREFQRQVLAGGSERVRAGVSENQIDILEKWLSLNGDAFWILYVLVVSRVDEHAIGRYQSPTSQPASSIRSFLREYEAFLERDGRHSLWISREDGAGQVVFDRHNIMYFYGDLTLAECVLRDAGFSVGYVTIPVPHSHFYHPEFDARESSLVSCMAWVRSDLKDGDD